MIKAIAAICLFCVLEQPVFAHGESKHRVESAFGTGRFRLRVQFWRQPSTPKRRPGPGYRVCAPPPHKPSMEATPIWVFHLEHRGIQHPERFRIWMPDEHYVLASDSGRVLPKSLVSRIRMALGCGSTPTKPRGLPIGLVDLIDMRGETLLALPEEPSS
jgi:hypothetical protein